MLLCVVVVSASASCVRDLPLGSVVQGNTSADCRYRVDLSGADDRLWSLELLSESVAIQVVVMDEQLVALQTLYSGKLGDGGALQETICRRTLPVTHRLESVFYLAPLGQDAVGFSLQVFSLPKAQLYLDKPVLDVISQRSHFFYFLLPEGGLPAPLSVAIESGELPDAPYQLQVSWKGCPDMTLRDSSHQVLSFVSKARMLVLPSQLESIGSPPPDVVYVGVRPRPHVAGSLVPTYNETDAVKNLTITLSYGPSFSTSGVAVAQWATMLAVLSVFVCAACCASYLVLRPGVKRLHSASSIPRSIEFAHEDKSRRLGDRRTRGRAKAYLWMIVLAGLFYLLPSLQTAGAEASGMLTSGNHDVCFFNEFCMFPLQTFGPYGIMWFAANNVLSNTGYIMMAIVIFSWTMWCKWMWGDKEVVLRVLSLPHDYTLFYCLAVALFFEGLMRSVFCSSVFCSSVFSSVFCSFFFGSATYHICPTRLLFTIDTTYMFVGSILISLEVYRKWFRMLPHPMFPFCLLTALMVFNYFGTFLDIYGAEDLAPIVQGQSDTAARVLVSSSFASSSLLFLTLSLSVGSCVCAHVGRSDYRRVDSASNANAAESFGFYDICQLSLWPLANRLFFGRGRICRSLHAAAGCGAVFCCV